MKKRTLMLPEDPKALLEMALVETDPVLKEKCLLEAEKGAPDDVDVQFELLMLGNLPAGTRKRLIIPSSSVICSMPLNTPNSTMKKHKNA